MGCSASRLEDEEAVQICKDRKNFIKQAIEQRNKFALGHVAYIQAIRRVSASLRSYVEGDDQRHSDSMSDFYSTPPFTPIKRLSPEMGRIPPLQFSPLKPIKSDHCVHYSRSGGNAASVSVEERPRESEIARINSYYNYQRSPVENYGMESIFGMQAQSPMNPSFFPPTSPYGRSPYNRQQYPPPSPSSSQWDFFWNPFASLESYGYPGHSSLNRVASIDDIAGLSKVREEEGIPDLEELDDEDEEDEDKEETHTAPTRPVNALRTQPTTVETNLNREDEQASKTDQHRIDQVKDVQCHDLEGRENVKFELNDEKATVRNEVEIAETGTPGFTVYMDRRPTSMSEVMRDIEHQFTRIFDSAQEVSAMLEASRMPFSSNSSDQTAIKLLNPITLFRSASSRSSSSRFLQTPSTPSSLLRDDSCETSSEISEESCLVSGSHQSTLDRLYAWEKKLYEEVKSGERIRKAYEKKCLQLKNQDATWEDPTTLDKMSHIQRDLHTKIKVSIHSIEAISRRIETLRDEELHQQITELVHGLGRMWRTMADCHRIQKRVIDDAKLLLANPKLADRPPPATRLLRSASNLEFELRNWRSCLQTWIAAQQSYAHALAGWLLRCAPPHEQPPEGQRSPLSPPRSSAEPPIFRLCIHWSRMAESVSEVQAVEGLDFFAAGVASVVGQLREAEDARRKVLAKGVVVGEEEAGEEKGKEVLSLEKIAEVGVRVVCAGMSVAVGGLAELAAKSTEGCENLARRATPPSSSV